MNNNNQYSSFVFLKNNSYEMDKKLTTEDNLLDSNEEENYFYEYEIENIQAIEIANIWRKDYFSFVEIENSKNLNDTY